MRNTNEPTFYLRATGNPDILEQAICTPNISKYLNFEVDKDVGSDHLPIIINMEQNMTRNEHNSFMYYSKLNCEYFAARLHVQLVKTHLKPIDSITDIDEIINRINKIIQTTIDECITKIVALRTKWWTFTKEIKAKIDVRHTIQKQ